MNVCRKNLVWLTLITIGGLALRLYDLGSESFWGDEAFSVLRADIPVQMLFGNKTLNTSQPLYYVILHYWIVLFGKSEFAVRLISALFGTAAIPLIYKVGERLFGRQTGILSALLLSLSVFHIWYSQEARMYSLMVLLALISMYTYLRVVQEARLLHCVLYVFANTLLLYTHYFGVFVVLVQNVHFAGSRILKAGVRPGIKRWLLIQGVFLLLYLPWMVHIPRQLGGVIDKYWCREPSLLSLYGTLWWFCGPFIFFPEHFKISFWGTWHGSVVCFGCFILLFFLGVFSKKKEDPGVPDLDGKEFKHETVRRFSLKEALILLLLWLLMPVLVTFSISKITQPVYVNRYIIASSLPLIILVGHGLASLRLSIVRRSVIAMLAIVLVINVLAYYEKIRNPHWRDVVHYIVNHAALGEPIDSDVKPWRRDTVLKLYAEMNGLNVVDIVSMYERGEMSKQLEKISPQGRIWYISTQAHKDSLPDVVKEEFTVDNVLHFTNIHLFILERKR